MSTTTLSAVETKWSATHRGNHLHVNGEVTMPTPGYKITLKKAKPQGLNPNILLLEKTVVAPTGIEPDHTVNMSVSFSEETTHHYTEVTILPDDVTIKVHQSK